MIGFFKHIISIACISLSALTSVSAQNILSKEQAISDIDSLVYTISEVHPDMFSVCKQGEFLKMVNDIKESLPDSVSVRQLYVCLQPLIVKIGDGHTSLYFPFDKEMNEDTPRIPIRMALTPENKVKGALFTNGSGRVGRI